MLKEDFVSVSWRISKCQTGWLVIRGEAMPFSTGTWHFDTKAAARDFVRDAVHSELTAFMGGVTDADLPALARALDK